MARCVCVLDFESKRRDGRGDAFLQTTRAHGAKRMIAFAAYFIGVFHYYEYVLIVMPLSQASH